jgi:uncharacterized damage-inducible protein DinB
MSISEQLLPEFEHEMANTRKILERVPEDKLGWKPHEKSMSLGRLAGHIAELPLWAVHTLTVDSYDITPKDGKYEAHEMTSRNETLANFDNWVSQAREALLGTPDEAYRKIWKLTGSGETYLEMPRGAVFRALVLSHMIHHRGQLSVYLRLNGVAVPGMYGPSADEMDVFATAQTSA